MSTLIKMAHVTYEIERVTTVDNPGTRDHGCTRIIAVELNHGYSEKEAWRARVHFTRRVNGWSYASNNIGTLIDNPSQIDQIDTALVAYHRERQQPQQTADTSDTPHKHRATVIDRALTKSIKITDDDVRASETLRAVALDYVATYKGFNSFVQNIAVQLADRGELTIPQMRGALNVMVSEARIERAKATEFVNRAFVSAPDVATAHAAAMTVTPADVTNAVYLDLRSNETKQRDDATDVLPANDATSAALVVPNGIYTVILDSDDPKAYRTLRVSNPPDHFNCSEGTQIVSYLSGPDNTSDYKAFAFLTGTKIGIWKSFRQAHDLSKALDMLTADPMTHAREYVLRSNRCFVCNHPLSTPQSIKAGIGPICAEKIGAMGYKLLMGTKDGAIEDAELRAATRAQHNNPNAKNLRRLLYATVAVREAQAKAQADADELFPD